MPQFKSSTDRASDRLTQLEQEVRRLHSAVEELTVLNDLAIAASSSLEVDQMLDIIVQKSIRATRAEQGSILLVTPTAERPLKTLIRQADRSSRLMAYKLGESITGYVLKYQKPLMIENLAADERFSPTEEEKREIHSVLCVPILFKGRLIGILTLTNKQGGAAFDKNDLRLLSIIAAQSGQLIRNSQLQQEALEKQRMEHELAMAQRIQMNLLPKSVPSMPRLDISSYFSAADEVSGDYFDYFQLGERQLGIVMADVSGHGLSSALVMTMVKGMLQVMMNNFHTPQAILASLNRSLYAVLPKEMFVTMVLLLFDLENMVLRFSNAGHNPILRCRGEERQCEFIELPGAALSIMPEATFSDREMPLERGDGYVIYTDGLTEAFNPKGEMFEERGLQQVVQSAHHEDAASMIERLRSAFHEFIGEARQSDDVAMIAVKIA